MLSRRLDGHTGSESFSVRLGNMLMGQLGLDLCGVRDMENTSVNEPVLPRAIRLETHPSRQTRTILLTPALVGQPQVIILTRTL